MDKQKQIKEMVDLYIQHAILEFDKHGFSATAKQMYIDKLRITMFEICSVFFETGYRKIPENAVVITDEELYEELNTCKVAMIVHDDDGEKYVSLDDYNEYTERLGKIARQRKARIEQLEKLLDDKCDRCIERERKETAEKFVERLIEKADENRNSLGHRVAYICDVEEICKELTEGK